MRWLMWFAIGFAAACGLGVYLVLGGWLLLLAVLCAIAFGVLLSVHTTLAKRVATVVLGCVVGFLWLWCFDLLYLLPVRQMDGKPVELDIAVTEYSRPSEYGITAEGRVDINGKTYPVQFYVNEDISLAPGDRVTGGFNLRYTGGGSEDPTYHRGGGNLSFVLS